MNMAVAMMAAAVVARAARKVRRVRGREAQRVRMERGTRKMEGKVREAPRRKRANIHWEAVRMRVRAEVMLLGRATVGLCRIFSYTHSLHIPYSCADWLSIHWLEGRIGGVMGVGRGRRGLEDRRDVLVAPASNSSSIIATGLNQYSAFGLLQLVISSPYPSQKPHSPTW